MADQSKYRVSRFSHWFNVFVLHAGLISITVVIPFVRFDQTSPLDELLFAGFYCLWAVATYFVLRVPYLITLDKRNSALRFKGIIGCKQISIENVTSIKVNFNRVYVEFMFKKGRLRTFFPVQRFQDLISELKAINKDIKTVRC